MANGSEPSAASKSSSSEDASRLGRFIQTYHSFLSSFVIGAAGLIATTIWQYRQAETTASQARAQQDAAEVQAENNWMIEKADILAKNLQTLSAQGPGNVEQKYGVLLSLTRGKILDPELAVSYALELGKENPDYMRSVLSNTTDKEYWRLARAFEPTCEQRYGISRPVQICEVDKLAERSSAIAELIAEETVTEFTQGRTIRPKQKARPPGTETQAEKTSPLGTTGPLDLLHDEHQVQAHAARLAWLFTPALINYYERRQWNEISKFEAKSAGARLVAALVLASARTGEFVSGTEAEKLDKFHSDHRKWLTQYLIGTTCDGECKAKLVEVMLTSFDAAGTDYDLPMRTLLEQPRSHAGAAVSHLHARLLWCQVDGQDLIGFRDRVLVPAALEMLSKERGNSETIEDLLGLVAVAKAPKEGESQAAWRSFTAALEKPSNARYAKLFSDRKAAAARERASPPPALKKSNFCISSPAEEPETTPRKASR